MLGLSKLKSVERIIKEKVNIFDYNKIPKFLYI